MWIQAKNVRARYASGMGFVGNSGFVSVSWWSLSLCFNKLRGLTAHLEVRSFWTALSWVSLGEKIWLLAWHVTIFSHQLLSQSQSLKFTGQCTLLILLHFMSWLHMSWLSMNWVLGVEWTLLTAPEREISYKFEVKYKIPSRWSMWRWLVVQMELNLLHHGKE